MEGTLSGWIIFFSLLLISLTILLLFRRGKKNSLFTTNNKSSQNQEKQFKKRNFFRGFMVIGFIVFAVFGEYNFLNFPSGEKNGLIFYFLASLIFGILAWYMRDRKNNKEQDHNPDVPHQNYSPLSEIKQTFEKKPGKILLFSLSIILAMLSLILLINRPEQNSHWDIFFLWVGSFLCYSFVFIKRNKVAHLKWINEHKVDITLILIFTLLGGIFRFYQLGKIPNIIDGDEGRFGLIIVDILEGRTKNMFSTIYGNSSMYFFILAGLMKLFGNSVEILRIGSAIGGTLTIPILYLMANNFFNRRTAIISTTLLVVSNFHIHFSHIMSVTSIQDALFATLSLYLFFTGLKNNSSSRMSLSGLVLGFALYIYMGARLIILLLPVYLLIVFILHPQIIKRNINNLLVFLGAFLIISLPMVHWAITNPDLFNIRAQQVGILQSGWLQEEAIQTGHSQIYVFLNSFKQAFLTTIFYPSHEFHYSSWPMLDMFSSIFFIAGLTYSLIHSKDIRFLLLNGWFWAGILIGGALVMLPARNTYRILIVFPVMCIFTGVGVDKLLFFIRGNSRRSKIIERAVTVGFIILISLINLRTYFISFAPNCRYEETNTRLASHVASYASTLDQDVQLYLLTAPQLRTNTHLSMSYLSPGRTFNEFINPLTGPPDELGLQDDYAFFFTPARTDELQWIEKQFPNGTVDQIYDCNVSVITVYLWTP